MKKIIIPYYLYSLVLHIIALAIVWTIPVNNIYPSVKQPESNTAAPKIREEKGVGPQRRKPVVKRSYHTIKEGDTLSKIAERLFNDPHKWTELWKLNPHIKNPNLLYAGDLLEVTSDLTEVAQLKTGSFSVIRKGDTLSKIAERLFNDPSRWRELWKLNPHIKDPDLIYEGDLLKTKRHLIEKPSKDPISKLTKHLEEPLINAVSETVDDKVVIVFLYDEQIMPDLPAEREDAVGNNFDKGSDKPVKEFQIKIVKKRPTKVDENQDKGPLDFAEKKSVTAKERDTVNAVSQGKGPDSQGVDKEDGGIEIKETPQVAFQEMESSTVVAGKAIPDDADEVTIFGIPEIEESGGIAETILMEETKGAKEWVPIYFDTEQKAVTTVTEAEAEETVVKKGLEKVEHEEKPSLVQQTLNESLVEAEELPEAEKGESPFVTEPREQLEAAVKEVEAITARILPAGAEEPIMNKVEIEESAGIAESVLTEETRDTKEWVPLYADVEQKAVTPVTVAEPEDTQLKITAEKVDQEEKAVPVQQTRNESRGEAESVPEVEAAEASFVPEPREQVETAVKEVEGITARILPVGAEEPVVKEIEIEESTATAETAPTEEERTVETETLVREEKEEGEETVLVEVENSVTKIERGEENLVAEILTPDKNRTPSRKEYLNSLAEEENREAKPEIKGEVILPADIEITVGLKGSKYSGISYRFLKKAHPMVRGRRQREDAMMEEFVEAENEVANKRVFSFAMSEKGSYAFIVTNSGKEVQIINLLFRLYSGKMQERDEEFSGVQVGPKETAVFKFILPEALFWDDDDYFTGMIEGSDSITKFNEDTGLVWKEKK